MKILPVEKIREADAYTIEHEPILDIDLMERAAGVCFEKVLEIITNQDRILIFSGTGNNGGDGLAIARMLHQRGYTTKVFMAGKPGSLSPSCRINLERYTQISPSSIAWLQEGSELPAPGPEIFVIDALFGSGLTRPVEGFYAKLIQHINKFNSFVLSIDVPSGMFTDRTNKAEINPIIIRADHTLTFAPPKIGFFYPENDAYVGSWTMLDIGISDAYLNQVEVRNYFSDEEMVSAILKPRNKFAHKGNFGHALLMCGGVGKSGAAVLAAHACLRSGAGLVTVMAPNDTLSVVQNSVPEAMCTLENEITGFDAIGAGPGIGKAEEAATRLKSIIQEARVPLVLDADALNILSSNKTWMKFLPPGTILTPHPKEFERLAGKASDDFLRHEKQLELSFSCQVYIILKGAHTCITTPDGRSFFNSTGNPGMATGGSGDVLTGILTGLLAQGYSPLESCLLGTFIHGRAGDIAAEKLGHEAMIAGDIIKNLGKSFLSLYGKF